MQLLDELDGISVDPAAFILGVVAPESIVVINLDRRPDRWDALLEAWPTSITERFVRVAAIDGQDLPRERVEEYLQSRQAHSIPFERAAGELGCRDSWIRAVSEYGPGLYFEDDARSCAAWSFGRPPNSAEIVLLGGELWSRTDKPGWFAIDRGTNGTHAIWIRTQRAADLLLVAWQDPRNRHAPVDLAWRSALATSEAVVAVPQIVCQADLSTDVQIGRVFRPGQATLVQPWCSLVGGERVPK